MTSPTRPLLLLSVRTLSWESGPQLCIASCSKSLSPVGALPSSTHLLTSACLYSSAKHTPITERISTWVCVLLLEVEEAWCLLHVMC